MRFSERSPRQRAWLPRRDCCKKLVNAWCRYMTVARGSKHPVLWSHHLPGPLLALLLSLSLAASACTSPEPDNDPTPPASETAWQSLKARVGTNGHVSRELALDAYATLIAPIPDGNKLQGDRGTSSGTMALRWLLRYWEELSAEQRSSVLRLFGSQTRNVPRASITKLSGSVDNRQPELQNLTDQVTTEFRATHKAFAPLKAYALFMPEAVPGKYAVAAPFLNTALVNQGPADNCVIAFSPNLVTVLDRAAEGDEASRTALKAIAAHELMHCHQINLVAGPGRVEDFVKAPDWVTEGSAAWGEFLFAYPSTVAPPSLNYWRAFFENSATDLFSRVYDAAGFWFYAADAWKTLAYAMSLTWSASESLGLSKQVLDNVESAQKLWRFGTSHARLPAFGPEWETSAPGLGREQRPEPAESISLAADQRHITPIPLRGFRAATVTLSGEVDVVVVTPAAAGAVHWGSADNDPDDIFNGLGEVFNFCIDPEGCPCPPGTKPRPGLLMDRRGQSHLTLSAFGEHELKPQIVIEASEMKAVSDRYCEPEIEFTACESWMTAAEIMRLVPGSTRAFERTFAPINDNNRGIFLCSWVAQKNARQEEEPFYDWAVDIELGVKLRNGVSQVEWDQWYASYTDGMECGKVALTERITACTKADRSQHTIAARIGNLAMVLIVGTSVTCDGEFGACRPGQLGELDVPRDRLTEDANRLATAFAKTFGG